MSALLCSVLFTACYRTFKKKIADKTKQQEARIYLTSWWKITIPGTCVRGNLFDWLDDRSHHLLKNCISETKSLRQAVEWGNDGEVGKFHLYQLGTPVMCEELSKKVKCVAVVRNVTIISVIVIILFVLTVMVTNWSVWRFFTT